MYSRFLGKQPNKHTTIAHSALKGMILDLVEKKIDVIINNIVDKGPRKKLKV